MGPGIAGARQGFTRKACEASFRGPERELAYPKNQNLRGVRANTPGTGTEPPQPCHGAIHLGSGNDVFNGKGGSSSAIFGDASNDSIVGGTGNDRIHGGNGNDTLTGGPGAALLYGVLAVAAWSSRASSDRPPKHWLPLVWAHPLRQHAPIAQDRVAPPPDGPVSSSTHAKPIRRVNFCAADEPLWNNIEDILT